MMMSDNTLCIAIDLGNTSARIACCRSGSIELIWNREGTHQTPCIVSLTPQGSFVVGREAQVARLRDPVNAAVHFVGNLGTDAEYIFSRSQQRFKPHELTAVLLKSLRADAEQCLGIEIRGVAITVPPHADIARCQATKQAAFLAGFTHCLLIQDAVAAALAAGLPEDDEHKTVLIYDFGGSGFSASLLRVRNGMFQVVAQAGDSFLGGTSLDREVIERVFVPALQAACPDLNLSQDNPQSGQVYARLLAASEAARMQLSRADETSVFVPGLRVDERQQPIDLECELTRSALERLAEPLVECTITKCDQVLAESRTPPAEVNNVISVGGMSLMPLVCQRLDNRFGGQILAARIDPATAAVQGAAIFAASQRLPDQTAPAPSVSPMEEEESPYARVLACASTPELFQTIGIALHDNRVNRLFEKGTALPARRRVSLRTVIGVRRGQSGDALRLPLVEGESERADRNRELGTLIFPLENVAQDLPPGTEVEVTVEINESREFRVSAYVPLLDAEFEQSLVLSKKTPSRRELAERLSDLKYWLDIEASPGDKVRFARLVARAERLLESSTTDSDAEECAEILNEITMAVDAESDWRRAVRREVEEHVSAIRELLAQSRPAEAEYENVVRRLESAAHDAIEKQKVARVQDCLEHLRLLGERISRQCHASAAPPSPEQVWFACLAEIERRKHQMDDPALARADSLVDRGNQAIARNDLTALNQSIRDVVRLLSATNDSSAQNRAGLLEASSTMSTEADLGQHRAIGKMAETGNAVAPTSRIDKVHFSVASPPTAQPGREFIVDVWAHLERQRAEVERRIQQARPQEGPAPVIRPKGPFKIERGTTLFVRLRFPDLRVEPPEDIILWEGDIGNASFEVTIPNETAEGVKSGLVSVHWEGGLQIARVQLQILVAAKAAPATPTTQPLHHFRKAFASYANPDRDEVLRAIQGMQKILPDLDVFLDVVKLRSGEDWEKRLWQVIPESDVFYLFWSAAAKASPWVEKEWRCALKSRGYGFIDPVPLVSPEEVRPPDELSMKHFNDWILAFRRGRPEAREGHGKS